MFFLSSIIPNVFGINVKLSIDIEEQPTFSSGLMDSPWPMKSHDTKHTGRSSFNTAENPGIEKWRVEVGKWVFGGPIIDNEDIIYLGDWDEYLYAFCSNSSVKWKVDIKGDIWSTPAIAEDGTIYVSSWDDERLWAINPDGTVKWRFRLRGTASSSPAIGENGLIYVGSWGPPPNGSLYAIYPNGTEAWHYETGDKVLSDAVIDNDGVIYFGSCDSFFYAINPDGNLKWRFKTDDIIKGHPSITNDGTVYIASFDDYLYAINPTDGSLKWKYDLGWGNSAGMAIDTDGTIYIGREKLYAINPNGMVEWTCDFGENRRVTKSSPAISIDGTIYVCVEIGDFSGCEIIAINSEGNEVWRKNIGNRAGESSPCIGRDGTIYIGSASNKKVGSGTDNIGFIHAFGPVDSNEKPENPTVSGPLNGNIGEVYSYDIMSIDPDINPISFYIDWGDGTFTDWHGGGKPPWEFYDVASGQWTFFEHVFENQGNFTIRAKAKDSVGAESDWTEFEVTMKKSKDKPLSWLEQFPIIREVLLRLINPTS